MQGAHKSHQTNLSRLHDVFVGPLIVRRIPLRLRIAALVLLAVAGCGFEHDEAIDGPYRLVATDVDEQMAVCYTLPMDVLGASQRPSTQLDTTLNILRRLGIRPLTAPQPSISIWRDRSMGHWLTLL